jgi:hypothetical protein
MLTNQAPKVLLVAGLANDFQVFTSRQQRSLDTGLRFRFSGRTYPKLAWIVRALRAVAGRCR